jgi:hypothetical protein
MSKTARLNEKGYKDMKCELHISVERFLVISTPPVALKINVDIRAVLHVKALLVLSICNKNIKVSWNCTVTPDITFH